MFYLQVTTSFGLGIDQNPLTLHRNCFYTLISCGAISMYRVRVGL